MSKFVSHDGDGTEVWVVTARGKVKDIDERNTSAKVEIDAPYLKWVVAGWVNKNEKALEVIRQAKENDEEVEVRLESQRKPSIDKSIPINTIRESATANSDIIKKLVCVNGVFTSEALTNPEDDPEPKAKSALTERGSSHSGSKGGTVPAANKQSVLDLLNNLSTSRAVTESILDALKAQALIAGATVEEVVTASTLEGDTPALQNGSFAREAPAFKSHNADGRLNRGGPAVAAGVGIYNYVYEHLTEKNPEAEPNSATNEYFAALILSMADFIQSASYGQGQNGQVFRPDREVGSHTRARSCLFAVIRNNPLPVTDSGELAEPEVINSWVKTVGAAARANFMAGIRISQQFPSVKNLLDHAANGGSTPEQPVPASSQGSQQPEVPASVEPSEPAAETHSAPQESTPEPVVETPAPEPASEAVVEPTVEEIVPEPAPVATPADEPKAPSDNLLRFEQNLLPPGAVNSKNSPSEELLAGFKEFVIEEAGLTTKTEQAAVGRLLAATFGRAYNKAQNIPEDELGDFLDFYVSTGVDNFKAVLATV